MPDVIASRPALAPGVREALARAMAPLSSCQQRVWRLVHAEPAIGFFERINLRFAGPLRVDVLNAALREVVRRHAILRTVFLVIDGQPTQCVRSASDIGVLLVDLQALPPALRERAAVRLARRGEQAAFDLKRGPFLRGLAVRVAPADHVLLLRLHHLVFDGWSTGVLFRELMTLYMTLAAGRRSPLPDLRAQYVDLARREQQPAQIAARQARVAACAARLAQRGPAATLPLDRPRPSHKSHRAAVVPFELPGDVLRAVRGLTETEGATAFMVLLAALAMTLRRPDAGGAGSPQTRIDAIVGVPMANRTSTDAQALIGPFVNLHAVRLCAEPAETVRVLLSRARHAMLEAFADQDVSFEAVLDALHPGSAKDSYGATGEEPVFRVCVDFTESDEAPAAPTAGAGDSAALAADLSILPFEADDPIAGCDLFVSFSARGGTLGGTVLHSAELFDRATIDRALDRLYAILRGLPRSLDVPIPIFLQGVL